MRLADSAWPAIDRARAGIEAALASGRPIYGVNTGFGKLAQTRIAPGDLKTLQRNLVLSPCRPAWARRLADDVVRLVMALKIASLARGYSGVRPVVVERLLGTAATRTCCRRFPNRDRWAHRAIWRRWRICRRC